MSFIRPEATHALYRWRETLLGAGAVILGLWWALSATGYISWIGWIIVMVGLALATAGVQRARFRIPGQGPGMVRITEGQITYFGPLTGGAIALTELSQIAITSSGKPAHWVLSQAGQPDLFIPLTAEGADGLFDAFSSLPNMRTEFMLAQMTRETVGTVTIWRKQEETGPGLLQG